MAVILILKLGKVTIRLAFLVMYFLCKFDDANFKILSILMIFKQSVMPAILFFLMRPKFFSGKTFTDQDFPWAIFTFLQP